MNSITKRILIALGLGFFTRFLKKRTNKKKEYRKAQKQKLEAEKKRNFQLFKKRKQKERFAIYTQRYNNLTENINYSYKECENTKNELQSDIKKLKKYQKHLTSLQRKYDRQKRKVHIFMKISKFFSIIFFLKKEPKYLINAKKQLQNKANHVDDAQDVIDYTEKNISKLEKNLEIIYKKVNNINNEIKQLKINIRDECGENGRTWYKNNCQE